MYTNREIDVIKLLAIGKSNKEIAKTLGISIYTVKAHIENIFVKNSVHSRMELFF